MSTNTRLDQHTHTLADMARSVRDRINWLLGPRDRGQCPKALAPQGTRRVYWLADRPQ